MKKSKRIIPISSGKGGVGKTTFALNYALALSRHAPTVLVDLDMGTSSVRNLIDTPVTRDLYHFFKQGRPLADCVTQLDRRLDPMRRFVDFGFVAAPHDVIDDVTNMSAESRDALIDAINGLDASYVVLDLKSGLDPNVIDFLPFSNSGILIFTPHLPAATVAASQVVKAMLFRKLRALFATGSEIYNDLSVPPARIHALIDRAEDTYDPQAINLDGFIEELSGIVGGHPAIKLVAHAVHFFRVHFVLNLFSGIKDSYETAIKPFTENILQRVSGRLSIMNLGWIIAHEDIDRANNRRVPVLLGADRSQKSPATRLTQLARRHLGSRALASRALQRPDPDQYLEVQLETLRNLNDDLKNAGYRENFKYIVYRSLHIMSSMRVGDFGDSRLFKPSEMRHAMARRQR
ncbi:MAG: P-loop NTPase [Vicinamibacteria bacterium]|nr:P-loop NTPase [Vicinamibacteria bacterium]